MGIVIRLKIKEKGEEEMSVQKVREFFEAKGLSMEVYELEQSTATVEEAAEAHGVEPGRIAKTMAIALKDRYIFIIMAGDSRLDNKKFKTYFGQKCAMVKFEDVESVTGHPVGGVCAFGNPTKMETYLDEGLLRFDYVYPAAGAPNASVRMTPQQMCEVTDGVWVDLSKKE